MRFASESPVNGPEGIVEEHAATQVQSEATALASPLRAFHYQQSGSFIFVARLIAGTEMVVSIRWSGHEDGSAYGMIAVPCDGNTYVGSQRGKPFVVRPGEVEKLGRADTSHCVLVKHLENPKLLYGVALIGKSIPADEQVAAGDRQVGGGPLCDFRGGFVSIAPPFERGG